MVITTFPPAPADFEPLTANEDTLRLHGFPPRPAKDSGAIKQWMRHVAPAAIFIEPVFSETKRRQRLLREELPDPSINWSGALVETTDGSTFTTISGQWTVPNPNPASDDDTDYQCSTWIGIGGYANGDSDLVQAGVQCDFVNSRNPQRIVTPWFQWVPDRTEVPIPNFPVSAGHVLSCLLTLISNVKANLVLRNLSLGSITTFDFAPPAGSVLLGKTAEWIAERPQYADTGAFSELANYGEVDFTDCSASTTTGSVLLPSNGNNVVMMDAGQTVSRGSTPTPNTVKCVYVGPLPFAPIPFGGRIAQLVGTTLSVKQGALNAGWVLEANNINDFALEDDRIAILDLSGNFSVKEGALNSGWVLEANNVQSFSLEGSFVANGRRIAILDSSGNLSVKEGALNAGWVLEANNVASFALEGNRIAVLDPAGNLSVKEGALNAGWVLEANNVKSFSLCGTRIATIDAAGNLSVKDGALNAEWVLVSTDTQAFDLSGDRIGTIDSNGNLSVKEGALDGGWYLESTGVQTLSLEEDVVAALDAMGTLSVKQGALNDSGWILQATGVSSFAIALNNTWGPFVPNP